MGGGGACFSPSRVTAGWHDGDHLEIAGLPEGSSVEVKWKANDGEQVVEMSDTYLAAGVLHAPVPRGLVTDGVMWVVSASVWVDSPSGETVAHSKRQRFDGSTAAAAAPSLTDVWVGSGLRVDLGGRQVSMESVGEVRVVEPRPDVDLSDSEFSRAGGIAVRSNVDLPSAREVTR